MFNKGYISDVTDRDHKGWLDAKLIDGKIIRLPYLIKVELLESQKNGQLIRLLESDNKDSIAFIPYAAKTKASFHSYISNDDFDYHNTHLYLDKSAKAVILNGKSYQVVADKSIPNGKYYIGFPLNKEKLSTKYLDETKGGSRYASSWFPLFNKKEFEFSRFIHSGVYSEGCVTVLFTPEGDSPWSIFYAELIRSRINDEFLCDLEVT